MRWVRAALCGVVMLALILPKGLAEEERSRRLELTSVNKTGFEEFTEPMTLEFKDMDIHEALRYFAEKLKINIIPGKDVAGRVSLSMKEVSAKDAFEMVLRSSNLAYDRKGNIFNVMTESEYKTRYGKNFFDTRVTRVFRLKYAIPDQAFNLLNSIKSEIGKILLDADSGVLLVMDTPERIRDMEATLEAMDQKSVIRVFNLKYARAKDIEDQLKSQLDTKKVGSIKSDERTNQVIVQTLPERMEDISRLIQGLDQKTRQILIDAKIIQVKLSDQLNQGVQWEGLFNLGATKQGGVKYLGSYPFSSVQSSTDPWRSRLETFQDNGKNVGSFPFSGTTSNLSASTPKLGLSEMHLGVIGRNDFDFILKYLQTVGDTRILSNPKLAVVNNQEAKIHVGERQAYITTTTTATQTSTTVSEAVTYVDVGIQLFVTPTINADGFVTVKIKPEISSVIDYLSTSSNNKIPIIDTSTAETIVMVKDGTSILIGGLSKEEKSDSIQQTPVLGRLPFIGEAFRQKTKRSVRSEMLVLLTPHITTGDELVTGGTDFQNIPDKGFQAYQSLPEQPAGQMEYKPYRTYPGVMAEPELGPGIKPNRRVYEKNIL